MKIVIAGGAGHLGSILVRALLAAGHSVVILRRRMGAGAGKQVVWDGRTLGSWADEIDGADAVINLAGRSVDCRYTEDNLRQMLDSRVNSTRVLGLAIGRASAPPRCWLQMSTATLYAHRFDAPNDEVSGFIGGNESDAPTGWRRSVQIAQAWEQALQKAEAPLTRKIALRTAMVMTSEPHGILWTLSDMVRWGLGGRVGTGEQFVSWLHEEDFVNAVLLLLERRNLTGAFNLAAPAPLPQRAFMTDLRRAWKMPWGLPITRWMAEMGAFILRTDTELLLKSRRVVPTRLLDAGFVFKYPTWSVASVDLVRRIRRRRFKRQYMHLTGAFALLELALASFALIAAWATSEDWLRCIAGLLTLPCAFGWLSARFANRVQAGGNALFLSAALAMASFGIATVAGALGNALITILSPWLGFARPPTLAASLGPPMLWVTLRGQPIMMVLGLMHGLLARRLFKQQR